MGINGELRKQLLDFLTPYMNDKSSRKTYLEQAFTENPSICQNLNLDQSPQNFTNDLISKLELFGEYPPGTPALCSLLKVIRENVGVDKQKLIDELITKIRPPSVISQRPLPPFDFYVVHLDSRGWQTHRTRYQAQSFKENLGNGITLEMVYIPGGTFMMGSPANEGYDREKPQHPVTIQPFFMGKYPITQAQWKAVATLPQVNKKLDPNPSYFKGNNLPVECVSWYDAREFCARINIKLKSPIRTDYSLPSEAQWEYACRAGTTTPFYFGDTITTDVVNYNGNYTYGKASKGKYLERTAAVGTFPPNAFGLYDMHGNVWEWCADTWHDSYKSAPNDGGAWINENDNQYRLLRGGSWYSYPENRRSACRNAFVAGFDVSHFGFRVVCGAAWT